jgi:hypothetical protein
LVTVTEEITSQSASGAERRIQSVRHLRGAVASLPDRDEFFWKIAEDAASPRDRITVGVTLPTGVPTDDVVTACATGGAAAIPCGIGEAGGEYLFAGRQSLEIRISWPKGFIHPPTVLDMLVDALIAYRVFVVPPLLLLLLVLLWFWRRHRASYRRRRALAAPRR